MAEIVIVQLQPAYFEALEALQRIAYPTLGEQELMRVEHFASQYRIFPEGQFVAVSRDESGREVVVGQGSGFFIDFDFAHPGHTFRDIIAEGYFTLHDPNGAYYYGADISVHPDYRGRGIGTLLYNARKALVRRYNRRGIVAGGLIPGFARYKHRMSAAEYVERVVSGELSDPTLTFQLRNGFVVRGVLENYLEDRASDNWSTLIEWPNPDYRPPT